MKPVWRELIGLFVDDGRFAQAILVWLALAAALLRLLAVPPWLAGLLFFGGFALLLVANVRRAAARVPRSRPHP